MGDIKVTALGRPRQHVLSLRNAMLYWRTTTTTAATKTEKYADDDNIYISDIMWGIIAMIP